MKTEKVLLVAEIQSPAASDQSASIASSARVEWSSPLLDRTLECVILAKIVDFWPKFHSAPETVTAVARTHSYS